MNTNCVIHNHSIPIYTICIQKETYIIIQFMKRKGAKLAVGALELLLEEVIK